MASYGLTTLHDSLDAVSRRAHLSLTQSASVIGQERTVPVVLCTLLCPVSCRRPETDSCLRQCRASCVESSQSSHNARQRVDGRLQHPPPQPSTHLLRLLAAGLLRRCRRGGAALARRRGRSCTLPRYTAPCVAVSCVSQCVNWRLAKRRCDSDCRPPPDNSNYGKPLRATCRTTMKRG